MASKDVFEVEIDLTPDLYETFMKNMNELYEIDILQGTKTILEDGMTRLNFTLTGEKAEMFQDFMRMLMQQPGVETKAMGLPINKN